MNATHSVVPYQNPHDRAFAAAQTAALGFGAAVLFFAIPLLRDYLDKGVFTKAQTVTLLTTIASGALGVLGTYVVKYIAAHGSDQKPTVTANGASAATLSVHSSLSEPHFFGGESDFAPYSPAHLNAITLPDLPGVDPRVLVRLVERNLTDHLDLLEKQATENNRVLGAPSPYPWRTGPTSDPVSVTANPHGVGTFSGDVVPPVAPEPVIGRRKRVVPPAPEVADTPTT